MNFDDNIRYLGNAKVGLPVALVNELQPEQWLTRSNQRYLPLVYDNDQRHTLPTRQPALPIFADALRPILALIADFYEGGEVGRKLSAKFGVGYFVRARLLQLVANEAQAEQQELHFSARHAHRIHVPLITNATIELNVVGEALHIPVGEIYEINNQRSHRISNADDHAGVHLELDFVLKGERCCCAQARDAQSPCAVETCGLVTGDAICDCLPVDA